MKHKVFLRNNSKTTEKTWNPFFFYKKTASDSFDENDMLVYLLWKDVRVVEGVDLERLCNSSITEGSNPSLSERRQKTRKHFFQPFL